MWDNQKIYMIICMVVIVKLTEKNREDKKKHITKRCIIGTNKRCNKCLMRWRRKEAKNEPAAPVLIF